MSDTDDAAGAGVVVVVSVGAVDVGALVVGDEVAGVVVLDDGAAEGDVVDVVVCVGADRALACADWVTVPFDDPHESTPSNVPIVMVALPEDKKFPTLLRSSTV